MMKTVTIYTDGACSGNPGPGGWGAILCYNGAKKELSGGEKQTTNNRMELTGVISYILVGFDFRFCNLTQSLDVVGKAFQLNVERLVWSV